MDRLARADESVGVNLVYGMDTGKRPDLEPLPPVRLQVARSQAQLTVVPRS